MKKILLFAVLVLFMSSNARAAYVNVALGAAVSPSAGSASGSSPANIVDGNYNSFSQLYGSHSAWWQLNIASQQRIDQIVIRALGYNTANGINYTLTSYDVYFKVNSGDSWTKIVDFDGSAQPAGQYANTHDLDIPVTGQYFLMNVNYSLWSDPLLFEIELNQDTNPPAAIPEPATLSLLLLGIAAVSGKLKK
ncbi:MAG: discoidin domain-containing protein [Candidatus Auribacterota bacterium]